MKFIRGLHNLRPEHRGCVATIGNFDGVHLGHQAVIAQVRAKADAMGLPSLVILFEPQPREFFTPETAPARLTSVREKSELLIAAGIRRVLCVRFDTAFCQQSAETFCQQVLLQGLDVKHLVVGDDFRFGSDRCGDFAFLADFGQRHGFTVEDSVTHCIANARVSSTRVRNALQQADFAEAQQLLGRPYAISGKVSHGDKIGRQLGVPTANILLRRLTSPLQGVYTVSVEAVAEELWPAVANVGFRPTVNGSELRVEAHLLDFNEDIYGRRVHIIFHKKIRDEEKFSGLDALKKQIHKDIAAARDYFTRH